MSVCGRRRLRPVPPVERARIDRLIADLDAARYAVRQQAAAELGRLGELAEPALRQALRGPLTLEASRRVARLLARWDERSLAEWLPLLRSVELLERIDTPDARALLGELARGAPGARLTREAQAALGRLARRTAAAP